MSVPNKLLKCNQTTFLEITIKKLDMATELACGQNHFLSEELTQKFLAWYSNVVYSCTIVMCNAFVFFLYVCPSQSTCTLVGKYTSNSQALFSQEAECYVFLLSDAN